MPQSAPSSDAIPEMDASPEPAPVGVVLESGRVRRRLVFYLSGFDPSGPSRYHQLYQAEGPRQARLSGYQLSVGGRRRLDAHRTEWPVDYVDHAGSTCHTEVQFLRWDDLVRDAWVRSPWRLFWGSIHSLCVYARNGSALRVLQSSWPAFVCLVAPGASALAVCLMALLLGALVCASLWVPDPAATPIWCSALGMSVALITRLMLERRWRLDWLARSAAFILRQARDDTPALEARMDHFGDVVASAIAQSRVDEVLVVGHSSGALLAVSVLARACARLCPREPLGSGGSAANHAANEPAFQTAQARPVLGFLSLGQCIPLLSFQPEATRYRQELACVQQWTDLCWVDISSPADGCCFALTDPCEVLHTPGGVDGPAVTANVSSPPSSAPNPKLISARFSQLFTAESYRRLRRDRMTFHFQYLKSGDRRGDYDYFQTTAGPRSLQAHSEPMRCSTFYKPFRRFGNPCR
jgi:hypothetical protein